MKISVVMTVYCGMPYLANQLRSLVEQSRMPDEIVICDDGLAEADRACIAGFESEYPELIRYIRNPARLGAVRNFEQAIRLASGNLILLADQDDFWLPEKIRGMAEAWSAASAPAGVFCDSAIADAGLNPTGHTHIEQRGFSRKERTVLASGDAGAMLKLFLRRVPAAGHDMGFSAELRDLLLPFPELPGCHDTWIGLVLAALGCWRYVDAPLTLFRQHAGNLSGSGRRLGLRGKLAEAKKSIAANSFSWNEKLYSALLTRVSGRISPEVAAQLEARRRHSAARAAMDCPLPQRFPLVMQEIFNGGYFRFGRGAANIAQDLLLRSGGKRS